MSDYEFNYEASYKETFSRTTIEVTIGDLFTYIEDDDSFTTFIDVKFHFNHGFIRLSGSADFWRDTFGYYLFLDALYDEDDEPIDASPKWYHEAIARQAIRNLLPQVNDIVKEHFPME